MAQNEPQNHRALADLVRTLSQGGAQTIIFADTFHSSPDIAEAIGAPEVMRSLQQNGVGTLVAEGDPSWEKMVQAYRNADDAGKERLVTALSDESSHHRHAPQTRLRLAKARYEEYENAEQAGLTVDFPDPRFEEVDHALKPLVGTSGRDYFRELFGVSSNTHCLSIEDKAFMDSLTPDDRLQMEKQAVVWNKYAFNMDSNREIAQRGENRNVGSGKHAYVYGVFHMTGTNDLDELTPNAAVIAVADKPGNEMLAKNYAAGELKDVPDYVYYVQEHRVVKLDTQEAVSEFIFGDASKNAWSLSSEQEAACRASVAHIRPYLTDASPQEVQPPLNTGMDSGIEKQQSR